MKIQTPRYNWQSYNFGSISLCMIMKNEARNLPRCLKSVQGLVDEKIIVDTGSTDNSEEVARSLGATVLHDPWQDDFSRPRNIGIEKATKQWILILDPDEVLLPKDHQKIRCLTQSKKHVAFWLTTRNYSGSNSDMSFRTIGPGVDPMGQYPGFVPSTKTRFFKNGLGIKFIGCWHELVDWYLMKNELSTGTSDVFIHHWAHELNQKTIEEKKSFSLRMGEKKVKEWPTNGQCWWELSVAEAILGYRTRAAHSLAQAFRLGFGQQGQLFMLARVLNLLGDKKRGSLSFEKGVCKLFPALTHIDQIYKPMEALIDGL